MGFNLLRMINEVGGGIENGKKLKAVIPGGSSCPVLRRRSATSPWITTARQGESMLGSGGVVIMDEDTCMVKVRCAS